MRYIIRPEHIKWTPKALAKALNIETRRWPRETNWGKFDYTKDFFMTYPKPDKVKTDNEEVYRTAHKFWTSGKLGQRMHLSSLGVPVPATQGINWDADIPSVPGKYICRPPLHQAGSDYRIVTSPTDIRMGEYISKVFPKDAEWRIVFVYGKPVITIEKYLSTRLPRMADPFTMPWTDQNNCMWRSVYSLRNPLLHTDVYQKLKNLPIIQNSHIVGADIMTCNKSDGSLQWVITEFNACPSLKVGNHIEQVAQHVNSTHN